MSGVDQRVWHLDLHDALHAERDPVYVGSVAGQPVALVRTEAVGDLRVL